MLLKLFVVLVVLWVLGYYFHIAGGLIHLLLVAAAALLVLNFFSGRPSAAGR